MMYVARSSALGSTGCNQGIARLHVQLLVAIGRRSLFPCWLSARGHCQFPEVTHIYCYVAPSMFKEQNFPFLESFLCFESLTFLSLFARFRFIGLLQLGQEDNAPFFAIGHNPVMNVMTHQICRLGHHAGSILQGAGTWEMAKKSKAGP